jgi:hypothetical protein
MKMRYLACCILLLVLDCSMAFAQSRFKAPMDRFKAANATQTNQKVAEHEDLPALRLDFVWNNSLNQWDSTYRFTFTYNINGKVVESIGELYNVTEFVPYLRTVHTYNSLGFNDTTYSYSWNVAWENQYRNVMDYDTRGNTILTMGYAWNSTQWDSSWGYRSAYTYVFNDKISLQVEEGWQPGTGWENATQYVAHYPSPAGWDTFAIALWDSGTWRWQDRYVDATWYDFSKLIAYGATLQTYDSTSWENSFRFDCSVSQYDSQLYLIDAWDGNSWMDSTEKILRIMDSLDHMIVDEYYARTTNWQLTDGYQYFYIYDGLGHTIEWVEERFDGTAYEFSLRQVFSTFFTQAEEGLSRLPSFIAYPNPCADRLNFNWEVQHAGPVEIMLHDLQGRLRVQSMAPATGGEVSIPISEQLENGTYVYRVRTREGVAVGKVTILR